MDRKPATHNVIICDEATGEPRMIHVLDYEYQLNDPAFKAPKDHVEVRIPKRDYQDDYASKSHAERIAWVGEQVQLVRAMKAPKS